MQTTKIKTNSTYTTILVVIEYLRRARDTLGVRQAILHHGLFFRFVVRVGNVDYFEVNAVARNRELNVLLLLFDLGVARYRRHIYFDGHDVCVCVRGFKVSSRGKNLKRKK